MQHHFDLPLLRALVAIADTQSFASAARETHRTQSAVTQQMQRLEEQIGFPLFEKHGRSKRLTSQGYRLLEYARRILSLNDEAFRNLQSGKIVGSLRVGGMLDVADAILPHLLHRVAQMYPLLQVEIQVARSALLNEMLKRGELDLVLGTRRDEALQDTILRTSPTVWLCSANFVYDRSEPLPLILADETSQYRKLALDGLERHGIRWRLAYLAPSLIGIKAAVRAGLGVTARNIEMLSGDMRVLGETEGLPSLPSLSFRLCIRREVLDPRIWEVYRMLTQDLPRHDAM